MLLGVLSAVGLSKRQIDAYDLVSLVLFSWAALTARRNFGPFAIVAAPILAKHITVFLDNWYTINQDKYPILIKLSSTAKNSNKNFKPMVRNLINSSLLFLLLIVAGWKTFAVNQKPLIAAKEKEIFPLEAVSWLKDSEQPGNLFNEYNWGGYLIWELREYPVFVDGRTDLFGDEVLREWSEIIQGRDGWQNSLSRWDVDYLLIGADRHLGAVITDEWEELYASERVLLLKRIE